MPALTRGKILASRLAFALSSRILASPFVDQGDSSAESLASIGFSHALYFSHSRELPL